MVEVAAQKAETLAAQMVEMAAQEAETLVAQMVELAAQVTETLVSWDPLDTLVFVDINFQLEVVKSTDENQQMISACIQIYAN